MTKDEIQAVLDLHGKWLRDEEGGQCANLHLADLSDANLSDADLSDANLRGASLYGADLRGANLSDANLRGVNLCLANLSRASLRGADLCLASLSRASLRGADLRGANLSDANLYLADLGLANLSDANLHLADLALADLYLADLPDANLRGANLPNGVKWETYISETVPALLTVGGRALADLRPAFACHDWTNCPMAVAFGVHDIEKIPSLYRSEAALFVTLFDAGAITEELVFGAAVT
jgi:hypothetical protein